MLANAFVLLPSSSFNNDRNGPVLCVMFHKIRGGKGEWREVSPWELIRVTKGVGKKVKMVVEAPGHFGPSDIHLSLTDMTDAVRTPRTPGNRSSKSSRFIIESTTVGAMDPGTGKSSAELIIKLFKLSKQLVFQASVSVHASPSDAGTVLRGQSTPFGTHNSGKQRRKRDKEGEEDDEDEFTATTGGAGGHHAHHHHHTSHSQQQHHAHQHHHTSSGASGTSTQTQGASSASSTSSTTSTYPRRKKQAKHVENDDGAWHTLAPGAPPASGTAGGGGGGRRGANNANSASNANSNNIDRNNSTGAGSAAASGGAVNLGEDFLESVWPAEDAHPDQQKDMIQQVNSVMRQFGHKYLMEEARKRRSGVVVYVACRRGSQHHQPCDDFTTFVYKQENLLKEDAVTIGTPLGRALFIQNDDVTGDSNGVYTLVAAVRMGLQDATFAPNSGIAAVYDFRRVTSSGPEAMNEMMMKTIPINPVLLSHEPTTVWLIGSFNIDLRAVGWLPPPMQQAAMQSSSNMAASAYPATMNPLSRAGGMGMGIGAFGGYGGATGLGLGAGNSAAHFTGHHHGVVPPLPLGHAPLAYQHLMHSPRGSLHSPVPYYGAASTPGGYLAPKAIYGGNVNGSATPSASGSGSGGLLSPSTTPVPGSSSGSGGPSSTSGSTGGAGSQSSANAAGSGAGNSGNGVNSNSAGGSGSGAGSAANSAAAGGHHLFGIGGNGSGSISGIPGAASFLGPPTPGLGQTPRGFGDLLSPFGPNSAGMMGSGFYSPLSASAYSQPLYMLDPSSLMMSARGLSADPTSLAAAAAGFYSPTSASSAVNSASTNSSTTTSGGNGAGGNSAPSTSLNLSQFKNAAAAAASGGASANAQGHPQPPLGQYPPYNFFSGQGGFPGTSPRFEELLDSARM